MKAWKWLHAFFIGCSVAILIVFLTFMIYMLATYDLDRNSKIFVGVGSSLVMFTFILTGFVACRRDCEEYLSNH